MTFDRYFLVFCVTEGRLAIYPEHDNRHFVVVKDSLTSREGTRMNRDTVRQYLKQVVARGGRLEAVANWP